MRDMWDALAKSGGTWQCFYNEKHTKTEWGDIIFFSQFVHFLSTLIYLLFLF